MQKVITLQDWPTLELVGIDFNRKVRVFKDSIKIMGRILLHSVKPGGTHLLFRFRGWSMKQKKISQIQTQKRRKRQRGGQNTKNHNKPPPKKNKDSKKTIVKWKEENWRTNPTRGFFNSMKSQWFILMIYPERTSQKPKKKWLLVTGWERPASATSPYRRPLAKGKEYQPIETYPKP